MIAYGTRYDNSLYGPFQAGPGLADIRRRLVAQYGRARRVVRHRAECASGLAQERVYSDDFVLVFRDDFGGRAQMPTPPAPGRCSCGASLPGDWSWNDASYVG